MDGAIVTRNFDKREKDFIEEEYFLSGEYYQFTKDHLCVFLDRKTKLCKIYEDRPQICRDFGTGKDLLLQCPFLKPNGKPRSEAMKKRFKRQTGRIVDDHMKALGRMVGDE